MPAVSQETTRAEPQVINLDVDETSDETESPTSPDINMDGINDSKTSENDKHPSSRESSRSSHEVKDSSINH